MRVTSQNARAESLASIGRRLEQIGASPKALLPVLAAFILLGSVAAFRTPLFQGYDEGWHYAYVEHYALGRPLPDLNKHFLSGDPAAPYWQTHEASQPPLYYALMGMLASLIPRGDLMQEQLLEGGAPNGMYGNFLPADRGTLGSGHVLAARLVRLATVLMGAVVVVCAYFIARAVTQRPEVGLLVAALIAFNPRVITLSAQISNDMAVACAASVSLWLAARIAIGEKEPGLGLSALLGAGAGISLLTKYSGGVIILAAIAAIACRALRNRLPLSWLIAHAAAIGLGSLLTVGWFFGRNAALYGDILAWNKVNEMNAMRSAPRTLAEMTSLVPYIVANFFGHPAYAWTVAIQYTRLMLYLTVPAAIGVVWLALRRRIGLGFAPMLAALAANMIAYYPWLRDHDATENMRFFSPVYVPITLLFALGLLVFTRRQWAPAIAIAVSLAYGVFIAVSLPAGFDQMYAYPRYLEPTEHATLQQRPPDGRVLFENGIELMDAQISQSRINSGETVALTLTWRTTRPITVNAHLTLDLRDEQDRVIAALNTANVIRYSYVPRAWMVGAPLRETYTFQPKPGANAVLRLFAGWHAHPGIGAPISPVGRPGVSVEVGRVKVRVSEAAPATRSPIARLPGFADLLGFDLRGDTVTLRWRATSEPDRNYTVFAHGLDAMGERIAQQDQPFDYGASWWSLGEEFEERIVAPGLGRARVIHVGVYDPSSFARLQAVSPDGTAWKDDIIVLSAP